MKQTNNELLRAVRFALYAGTAATVGLTAAPAFAQDQAGDQGSEKLETIVVTGSRIRRVDLETSSPVVTIDKAAIEKSGKLTVGDLVQEMPAVAGAATNPRVNNGGGTGAATVSLRGLGSNRTLLLINGKRAVNNDVNSIPASLVERIEVLKDGASAVYGSDAIGGVVNFILRDSYQGAEFSADYGVSDRDDGERKGASFTFGHASDRGSIMGGVNYNKYDPISSADRDYAKDATYLYSGTVTKLGSSRTPNGRLFIPASLRPQYGGCSSVTKLPGASGTSRTDYRCYTGADSYNYQQVNLVLTPQERTNAFLLGNYKLTDGVEAYMQVMHNKTTSNFAIAPLPFDANSDGVVISKDNFYNPFGVDFGPTATSSNNFRTRFVGLGQRRGNFTTTTDQGIAGLKGAIGDTSWTWDASFNYGHYSQLRASQGYVYYEGLRSAFGPSFRDTDGVIKCGSAGNVIAGCTPLNLFDINSAANTAALSQYVVTPFYNTLYTLRQSEVNFSGELFELPAGTASLAVGASHRKEYQKYDVDFVAITTGDNGTCFISQEACSTPLKGGFTVKEAYAELFVPILKDVAFAQSLNLIVGSRYSDYNTSAGNNTSNKFAVEWRPLEDLLVRGTVSEVFRAPNISELYAGKTGSAPSFQDPCIGYTGGATHSEACGAPTGATNIPTGGIENSGLSQTTAVVSGAAAAGINLRPEQGKSFDFGLVYDPKWVEGLSVNFDFWRIYLNDTILNISAQTVVNSCYVNGSSPFCGLIHRTQDGQVAFISSPTANLGRLDTKGVDIGFKYRLPETSIGNFGIAMETTYIAQYDNLVEPGAVDSAGVPIPAQHVAGHYNRSYGNYARWRALASVNWNLGNWDANWRIHYVGPLTVGNEDLRQGTSADAGFPGVEVNYGAQVENSVAVGYNFDKINTRVDVGVDNIFDKQPPLFFQNNVINANTDVNTYDTIGRYFWARVGVKF